MMGGRNTSEMEEWFNNEAKKNTGKSAELSIYL